MNSIIILLCVSPFLFYAVFFLLFLRVFLFFFFFSSRRRHTRCLSDWSSDVCSSDLFTVRSTVEPKLQRIAEATVQEGLARYELNTGRYRFEGAEANLADAIRKLERSEERRVGKESRGRWAT